MIKKSQRNNKRRPIKIHSLDVGREAQAHEIALNQAYTSSIDIILIQEPYIFRDRTRRITKYHSAYVTFSPVDNWILTRLRAISYVRKGSGIRSEQIPFKNSGDIFHDLLAFPSGSKLNVLNTYTPPGLFEESPVTDILHSPASLFKGSSLLQGDFNLHHTRWQPSWPRSPSHGAEGFLEWLDRNNYHLLSPVDNVTHNRGNFLELAFGKGPFLENLSCSIAQHLNATSDHLPLFNTIYSEERYEPVSKLRTITLEPNLFLRLLSVTLGNVPVLTSSPNLKDLDFLAESLTSAIHEAYSGAALKSRGYDKGNLWWDSSCRLVRSQFEDTIRGTHSTEDIKNAKKQYLRVIHKAKDSYFKNKIDKISKSKEIFGLTKRHKSIGKFHSAPLKDPEQPDTPLAITPTEKSEILMRNLLTNHAEVGDIPLDAASVPRALLPFPTVTLEEMETAVINAGNTAPEIDEIPTSTLKHAWPLIKEYIKQLIFSCIKIGYHPFAFHQALVIILQKPNKTDLSSPRYYRPISLLSVRGKGLERLLAKRIAWLAIRNEVITSQ